MVEILEDFSLLSNYFLVTNICLMGEKKLLVCHRNQTLNIIFHKIEFK